MRHILSAISLFIVTSGTIAAGQNFVCGQEGYIPQSGDLIFQQSAQSEVESSIQSVTNSIEGYDFTHVGMVYTDPSGEIFVLEAAPPEVTLTPIDDYLHPSSGNGHNEMRDEANNGKPNETGNAELEEAIKTDTRPVLLSVAARLKPEFRHLIPGALVEGKLLLGKRYDYAYTPDNEDYYCSELIYEILRRANGGQEVFVRSPMTFKSPETDKITDGWIKYFDRLGVPIPEGEPGTNPGAMSLSSIIEVIHCF